MSEVRIIICSNDVGSEETVYFTEDFEMPPEDVCKHSLTVDSDDVVEMELPNGFPLDYTLNRA